MKTFSALKNNAEFQAARLGLVRGNAKNRGSWYDRKTGEFVAKTVGGSLEFYNKGQQVGKQDRPQTDREKKLSYTTYAPIKSSFDFGTAGYERELREKYINEEIFAVGDMIKCIESNQEGEIMRRGANYLICVTDDDEMFKPWIKNVFEKVVNYPGPSGVPPDQRLVGTDAHLQYVARLTGYKFINKYRKKVS